ncbi:hypothetical protein GOP47_0001085 [Adiantum capillus-veneris]|uniref:Uncharacterized protein n=1 Tax=Adiantum capillus-veneris TaxID=13818 RepID=A0A9D4VEM0_ADICA|nr:hypothetical protein GOP47_0000262 [Adiantum capillus-veneris]KAI5084916.1 hypothetical protein GOP47_0001085 [Adiantum capillus-veneris]
MASRKVIRRLGALLHPSRGFCHKQELGDQLHPRSSSQLLAALEPHVTSSGKELFQGLMDVSCLEKEVWKQKQKEIEYQKEAIEYQNKLIAYLEENGVSQGYPPPGGPAASFKRLLPQAGAR